VYAVDHDLEEGLWAGLVDTGVPLSGLVARLEAVADPRSGGA
jgi:hypothetical protein